MSKESAKKLISELQTNEELKAKIAGITDPAELTKKAVEAGYDVTTCRNKGWNCSKKWLIDGRVPDYDICDGMFYGNTL